MTGSQQPGDMGFASLSGWVIVSPPAENMRWTVCRPKYGVRDAASSTEPDALVVPQTSGGWAARPRIKARPGR
jgi:hypothetical protein